MIPGLGRPPGEGVGYPLQYSGASLVAQLVKNPPAMREIWFRSLDWEDCLENPHGQRNLVGYSPWDHKELDMSEQLIFTFYRSPNRLSFWRKLMPVV